VSPFCPTEDFETLASGPDSVAAVLGANQRLVGTVPVATTLQQSRSGYAETNGPFAVAYTATLPSLPTMTRGALNVLSHLDNGDGIFLQIEGGAVDWAAHRNQTARLVEEQVDFNLAVQVVIEWIEAHGGWAEQGFDGRYVDNTDVFHVAVEAMSHGIPAEEHVVR